MPRLVMLKGLPGSGKSTWAFETLKTYPKNSWKRVNKDDLRNMIDAGRYSKGAEEFIKSIQDSMVRDLLKRGHNVIVDNTHLDPKWELHWRALAKEVEADFVLQDFTDVPLEECISNDFMRHISNGHVGEKVIMDMYNRYLKETPMNKWREHNPELSTAIVVDVDGTLADHTGIRGHHDYDRVGEDRVVAHIARLVQNISDLYPILIVSGRPDAVEKDTIDWLNRHFIPFDDIYMRKTGDRRSDTIIKREIFDEHIDGKWNVEFVLDDRDRVVDMWRKDLNIPVLQVNYGDF